MAIDFMYKVQTFHLKEENELKKWILYIVEKYENRLGELVFVFLEDNELLNLNITYLNHHTLTDVITFDYSEENIINGDVCISIERVMENSKKFKVSFKNELFRVMIHGVLHLLGFNDKSESEKKEMRMMEEDSLSDLKNYLS